MNVIDIRDEFKKAQALLALLQGWDIGGIPHRKQYGLVLVLESINAILNRIATVGCISGGEVVMSKDDDLTPEERKELKENIPELLKAADCFNRCAHLSAPTPPRIKTC